MCSSDLLFQQVVGEDIANLGFDYVNGAQSTLEPLRNILERSEERRVGKECRSRRSPYH